MNNYTVKHEPSKNGHGPIEITTTETTRIPMGQCPLCYTENPYSISVCTECSLPLPWASAPLVEREPSGKCLRCAADNPYSMLNCLSCGGRLPWANAVSPTAEHVAQIVASATQSMVGPYQISMPAPRALSSSQLPQASNAPAATRSTPLARPANVRAMPQVAAVSSAPAAFAAPVMDEPSLALNVASFLVPPVGLGAFLKLQDQTPERAGSAGRKAVNGLGLWALLAASWFIYTSAHPKKANPKDYAIYTTDADRERAAEAEEEAIAAEARNNVAKAANQSAAADIKSRGAAANAPADQF